MSVYSDNVTQFATRAEQRIREYRRACVEIAVECLVLGDPDGALGVMLDLLGSQMRVAGIRSEVAA